LGIIKLEFILENGRIFRIEATKLKDLQNKQWFWNFLGLKMPAGMEEEPDDEPEPEEAEPEPEPQVPPPRRPAPRAQGGYPFRQPPQQQAPPPDYGPEPYPGGYPQQQPPY
jgi:hypothetical protein